MKDIKIKKYFKSEAAYNNVVQIYRNLHGKKNLGKRIFFKAYVYAGISQMKNPHRRHNYRSVDDFFSPTNFNMKFLNFDYGLYSKIHNTIYRYGIDIDALMGEILYV